MEGMAQRLKQMRQSTIALSYLRRGKNDKKVRSERFPTFSLVDHTAPAPVLYGHTMMQVLC